MINGEYHEILPSTLKVASRILDYCGDMTDVMQNVFGSSTINSIAAADHNGLPEAEDDETMPETHVLSSPVIFQGCTAQNIYGVYSNLMSASSNMESSGGDTMTCRHKRTHLSVKRTEAADHTAAPA